MKTYVPKVNDQERKWYIVNAENQVLGRLATQIAGILAGKNNVAYIPNVDCGEFVIVLNAEKVHTTGRKLDQKIYYRYTGYPGGLKSRPLRKMLSDKPELVIWRAVRGMLRKNRLGAHQLKRLKVYAGEAHPHQAQKPETIAL
ncbi:MAG: 50S ribosomal protein L13 [Candidatus Wallbacteria bacterium]|nr:50S ribosomal protein L13 [Candidatus Wallbacteria bacterium]